MLSSDQPEVTFGPAPSHTFGRLIVSITVGLPGVNFLVNKLMHNVLNVNVGIASQKTHNHSGPFQYRKCAKVLHDINESFVLQFLIICHVRPADRLAIRAG